MTDISNKKHSQLIIVAGINGSGKSFWIKQLINKKKCPLRELLHYNIKNKYYELEIKQELNIDIISEKYLMIHYDISVKNSLTKIKSLIQDSEDVRVLTLWSPKNVLIQRLLTRFFIKTLGIPFLFFFIFLPKVRKRIIRKKIDFLRIIKLLKTNIHIDQYNNLFLMLSNFSHVHHHVMYNASFSDTLIIKPSKNQSPIHFKTY